MIDPKTDFPPPDIPTTTGKMLYLFPDVKQYPITSFNPCTLWRVYSVALASLLGSSGSGLCILDIKKSFIIPFALLGASGS